MNDLRFAIRQLAKNPGYTIVAVLTLGLGIGINLGVFSLLNEQFLRPRAVQKPEGLWAIRPADSSGEPCFLNVSRPYYEAIRNNHPGFESVIGYDRIRVRVRANDGWDEVAAELVSGDYFAFLGIQPVLGRGFLPEEDGQPGTHSVAIIGHQFWQEHFGGDRAVLGKTVALEGQVVEVVGVCPVGFAGSGSRRIDLWFPTSMEKSLHVFGGYSFLGRLKTGVSAAQAAASLSPVVQDVTEKLATVRGADGDTPVFARNNSEFTRVALLKAGYGGLEPEWKEHLRGEIVRTTGLASAGALLVLLIAASNLASVLLARAHHRRKEMATRLALGATRWVLVRPYLFEGVILAVLGTVGAIVLLTWLGDLTGVLLRSVNYVGDPLPFDLDGRVTGCAVLLILLVGAGFSVVPALQATRFDPWVTLKQPEGGAGFRGRRWSVKEMLVVAQVVGSLVLLSGTFICVRAIRDELRVSVGFKTQSLLAARVDLAAAGYDATTARPAAEELRRRLGLLPGVTGVAVLDQMPLEGAHGSVVARRLDGYDGTDVTYGQFAIGPGGFSVLGIPILQGRDMGEEDLREDRPVALVNQSFANAYWTNQWVLGKEVSWRRRKHAVIGVVQDARLDSVTEPPRPTVFLSPELIRDLQPTFILRTRPEAKTLINAVRSTLAGFHPRLRRSDVIPLPQVMRTPLHAQRNALSLIGWLGGLALALTLLGTYGMMSYLVGQRTREFGIRLAIGARRGDIAGLVLRSGSRLALAGLGLGLGAAWVGSWLLRHAVYGLPSLDLGAFGLAVASVLAAMLFACWLPARHATKVEPTEALRHE